MSFKFLLALLGILVQGVFGASNSTSIIDPTANYCSRVYHQSVVKNGTLYIDGGIEKFSAYNNYGDPLGGPTLIGYNTYLIAVDMSTSWDWLTNISISEINKTADPGTGTAPPVNVRGALYAGAEDDPNVYLYGGTVSFINMSFPGFQWPTSPAYSLWSYGAHSKSWGQYDVSLNIPERPAGGAYAEALDMGLGFYLNGFIDNGSSSTYADFPNFRRYMDGLVVLNTTTQEAYNISTSSLTNYPRALGGLVNLPYVGSQGALISMGGVTKSATDSNLTNIGTYVSFDSVDLLDIASINTSNSSATWYTQPTTGTIPDPRTDFCLISASAPDNSSHNIYLYGGKDDTQSFDQVYILSIPSFVWIKIYESKSPRYGHTCHLVAQSQMLTVGGAEYYDDLFQGCDWEDKGVAIMNLLDSKWGSTFNADAGEYLVPSTVYSVIGGGASGNATMTTPSKGFSNDGIAAFFNQDGTVSTSGATSSSSSSSSSGSSSNSGLSGGAIAGIAIGSVAGVAIIIIILAFFLIKRRRKQAPSNIETAPDVPNVPEVSSDEKTKDISSILFRNPRKVELPAQREGSYASEMPDSARYEMQPDSTRYEMEAGNEPVELPAYRMSVKRKSAKLDDISGL